MKRVLIRICAVVGVIAVLWCSLCLFYRIRTNLHFSEFSDPLSLDVPEMAIEGFEGFRVMHYNAKEAEVYYYSDEHGEMITFSATDDGWTFAYWDTWWSRTGSAEDYLVFPYFKKPLF